MYNELNNTRAACDQLSREKVKTIKNLCLFEEARLLTCSTLMNVFTDLESSMKEIIIPISSEHQMKNF